jgi:2-dehydropantoate 2-reductase
MALRLFPNVYGITVMVPADYLEPGIVCCYGAPKHGIFDIGRYPKGSDDVVAAIAAALEAANFAVFPTDDVMPSKYGKLLLNLHNVVDAALDRDEKADDIRAAVRAEAEAVYRAAGIVPVDVGDVRRRDGLMKVGKIDGAGRAGGSSRQSLLRGTGSIEIDYLNGEIVLLGRLHGVPAPANAWLTDFGAKLIAEGKKPGETSADELRAGLKAAGVRL